MNSQNQNRLDFDYLTNLAQSDPSAFERLRQSAIEGYLATLPSDRQQRLRRLQWRIDQERRNHTPLGACVKLSRMMWDHLLGPGGLVGSLHGERGPVCEPASAKVIPFRTESRP
jgi:hypothetical protein